ncbi:hypothetical protein CYY_003934 [Polysphondylium violaceum]|uniref:Uncharacterized protein n=1 Tax=Polysphondylium violaceum TaxID=133409 RepID=A0A8J4UTG1_9MYCE|nr:hypothetical protein CYY_003934 [Polysphondylium violaceum]
MVQSWNFEAVKCLKHVFKNRSLVIPHLQLKDIRNINYGELKELGFTGILFDKDNTLTEPYKDQVYGPFQESIKECERVFGKENIAIISNSAGSSDDVNFNKANKIEKEMGITVLKHGTKKPDGIDSVVQYFKVDSPNKIIMVGDRFLTDILFGNLYGMFTIYINPITSIGDNFFVKLIRNKEKQMVESFKNNSYQAPFHPLWHKSTLKEKEKENK